MRVGITHILTALAAVMCLVASKRYLFSGSNDNTIKQWAEAGQVLWTIKGNR